MGAYRVLMIAPTPFFADRGCHVRIAEEALALQAAGHTITICTYHHGRNVPGLTARRIPRVPWYRRTSAGPSVHKFYLDVMLMALAARVAREERPDILHAHLHEGAFIAGCIRRFCPRRDGGERVPIVFDLQGSLTGELAAHKFVRPGSLAYQLMHGMEARIDGGADIILPSSAQVADELLREFPHTRGRVEVVSDGVNAAVICPRECRAEVRERLGIPAERKVIGYLGLLTEYQGIDCLIDAMRRVLVAVPEAHLILLGWPNEDRYRALARKLGVGDRVSFIGKVEHSQAPEYLAAVDIAVAPKVVTTESNLKVRDYMACGLPTVTFDLPVNREMLGDLGIYAEERTSESLAAALVRALSEPHRWGELGARSREVAVREFSWQRAAARITAVYDRLSQPAARHRGVQAFGTAPERPEAGAV